MSDEGDRSSAPPRALRQLVEELAAETQPAVDWDRVESQLLARLEGESFTEVPAALAEPDGLARPDGLAEHHGQVAGAPPEAENLVPWDDDPADDALWKSLRRPPEQPLAPRRVSTSRGGRWLGGALVAAALAAGWLLVPRAGDVPLPVAPVDLASVALAPRLVGVHDLASLRAGDVVEASEGPVRFGREGVLSWTLSAGGRVQIVAGIGHEEPRHIVSLEAGALDAEVVPAGEGAPLDRFVIEVADARVAVHGTAFRVVRSSRGVMVEVSRGVVAVGPRSGALGSGLEMGAPERATFLLDGSGYRALPRRTAFEPIASHGVETAASVDERYLGLGEEQPPASHAKGASPALDPAPRVSSRVRSEGLRAPATAESGGGDTPPATTAVPWTAERVKEQVSACIVRRGAASSSEARVSIASQLVIDVAPAGVARAVRFEPPIRPELQTCAQAVLQGAFSGGEQRLRVPIEVVLEGATSIAPR